MKKRLYRSNSDVKIAGVAAGMAEFFNIDPTIMRIIWLVALFSQFGLPAYIVCAFVIPKRPVRDIKDIVDEVVDED